MSTPKSKKTSIEGKASQAEKKFATVCKPVPKVTNRPAVQIVVPPEEQEEFLRKLKELLGVTELPFGNPDQPVRRSKVRALAASAETEPQTETTLAFSLVQEGIPWKGHGDDR